MLDICTIEIYPNPHYNISNFNFLPVILESCLKLRVDYIDITVTKILLVNEVMLMKIYFMF